MITEKYITAIIQLKQLNIAPKINPRTKILSMIFWMDT